MEREEILKKAIEKSVENGYKGKDILVQSMRETNTLLKLYIDNEAYHSIIFDRVFM
jgi:hypothetical protein